MTIPSAALAATQSAAAASQRGDDVYQLRIYEIFDGNKAAFHDRFRDHAARIMAPYGFDFVAMWEARGEDGPEFVHLLRWPDEATMARSWASFMADEEWSRIKEETAARHGLLVGRIQNRVMRAVVGSSVPD
jgi:hypothetical protein